MGVKSKDMTQEATRKRTSFPNKARILTSSSWYRMALAAVLVLSAFLNLFRLTQEGYGNTYYAATVKNMLASWSNFFFVSYDAGFVSVDKPPLGLWICPAERVGGLDRGELRKGATRAVAIGPRRRRSTNSEG